MNGFDEEDDLNIAQDTSADILNKSREASSDALADSSFVDGDGESPVFPSGEANEWGGNLRNEGRKVMLRRDKNGKVSGYSTTTSMTTKDDDGSFVVIPTVVDGNELSPEDAVSHYRKTGEYWGKADDEDSARKIARMVHERHQSGYQRKWNDYIHSHWDDMSDDIRNDAGVAEEHARRVGSNSDVSDVAQNQPTFTRDEMLGRFANGGGYTEEEVDSMTDDQYRDFVKTSEEYFSEHPTMEMQRAKAQKNKERWDYADNLAKMSDYVDQQTKDDPDLADVNSEAKKYSKMLKQYGRNFGNLSAEDQTAFAENIGKMYEDAKNRRGFVEKMADSFARGHESLAAFIYRGGMLFKPGELNESDMQTLEGSRRTQELADIMHPKQSGSYKDNKDIGDWVDYIAENAAENVERIAVGAAASTAGAILAPYVGVSAGVGAIAGGTAGTLLLNGGEAVSDQLDEAASDKNINFSRGLALGQTGYYAVLDGALGVDKFFGNVFSKAVRALGQGVVKEGAAKALAETAKNSTLGGFLKSYGRNILEEAIQEPAQSQIGGRGRRYLQTGDILTADELEAKRSGRDSNPVLTATIDEGLGGAGAAAILGFFGGASNSINANRVVKLYDNMLKELKKETNYNSFSTEERLLITQRLANDALLETSGIFKEEAKEKIQKMSDEINSALSSQGRAYVDMFKQQFSALPMDEALAAASAAGIKTRFNADSMNGQQEELSIGVDGGETRTLTSPETGIRVSRHVNAEGKVSYAVENASNMKSPFANCVFDTGDEKADFENAVKYASELDVYNQYRAKQQEDKRKAIDRVYRNMYGERSPELVFVDRPNVAERKLLPVGHKAAYDLNGNRVLVDADAVDTLGSLYTLLGHERSHADIAEGFAKESFAPGGPTDEQIGKVEEGRQKYFGKDNAGKEQIEGSEKTTNLNRQVSAFEVNDIYNKAVDSNGNFSLGKFRMEFEKLFDLDRVSDKDLRKFAGMLGSGKNDAQSIRDGLTALYINNEKRRKMIGTESGSPDVVRKGNDWGESVARTGEEMVAERMSVNDLYNALSSSSRGLLSEGAVRLAKAIGIKMAFDMGVDPSLITSADVQKELGHILRSGYAGQTSKYKRPDAVTSNEDAAPEEPANEVAKSAGDAPTATPAAPAETTAVETAPVAPKGGTYLEPMVDGEGEDIPVGTVIQRRDGRMFTKTENGWVTDFEDKKVTTSDSDATVDGWRYVTQGKATPAPAETKINKNSAQVDTKTPEEAETAPQKAPKAADVETSSTAKVGNSKQRHTAEVTKEASGGKEVARFVDKDGILHVKNEQNIGGKPRVTETLIDKEGNVVSKPAENASQSAPSAEGITSRPAETKNVEAAPVASEAMVADKPAPKTEKDSLFDSMVESAESKTPAKKGETKYDKARKIPGLPRNAKGRRLYPADPAELLNQYEKLLNHSDHTASTLREAIDTVNSDWGKKVTYKKVTDEHNARLAKIIEAANDRVSKLEDQQREERGQRNTDRAHNRQSVMSVEEERDMLKWYRDYMADKAAWINAFIQGNRWNGIMQEPPVTYRFKPGTYYAYPVWGYRTSDDGTVREHDLEDKFPASEFFEVEFWDRNYKGHKKGDVKGIKFRDGADLNAYHMLFGKTTKESTAAEPVRDQSKVSLSFHGAFGEDRLADSGMEFDDRVNGSDISYDEIFDQLVDQYYEMRDLWDKHQKGEGEEAMAAEMEAAREAERAANPEADYNDQRVAEDDEVMKALYGDEVFDTMADDTLNAAYETFGDPDIRNKSEGEMIAGAVLNGIPEVYKSYSDTKLMRMAYDHDPNAFGLLYDRFMIHTENNKGGLPRAFARRGVPEGNIDDLCGKVWDRFLKQSMNGAESDSYHKVSANTKLLGIADSIYMDYVRKRNGLANRKGGEVLNLDEAVEDDSGDKMNRMDAISQEAVDEVNVLNGRVDRYKEYLAAVDKVAGVLEYLSDGRAKMLRALLEADSGIGEDAETVADTEHTDDFGNLESLKKLNSREKRYSTRTLAKAAEIAGMPPYLYIHELGDLFKEIKAAHTGKDREGKRIALMVEPEVETAYTNNELSDFMEDDRKGMWAFMTRLADEKLDNAEIAKRWNDTLKDAGDSVGANTVRGVLSKAKLLYGWKDPRPSEGSKYQQQLGLDTDEQTSSREISDFAKTKIRGGYSDAKVTDMIQGKFGLGKLEAANVVSKAKSAITRKTKSNVSQGDLFATAEDVEPKKVIPFKEKRAVIREAVENGDEDADIVKMAHDRYGMDGATIRRVIGRVRETLANAKSREDERIARAKAKEEQVSNALANVKIGKAEKSEPVAKEPTYEDMIADARDMADNGLTDEEITDSLVRDYGQSEDTARLALARIRGTQSVGGIVKDTTPAPGNKSLVRTGTTGEYAEIDKREAVKARTGSEDRLVNSLMEFYSNDRAKVIDELGKRGYSDKAVGKMMARFATRNGALSGIGELVGDAISAGKGSKDFLGSLGLSETDARKAERTMADKVMEEVKGDADLGLQELRTRGYAQAKAEKMIRDWGRRKMKPVTFTKKIMTSTAAQELFGDLFSFKSDDTAGGNENIRYKTTDDVLAMSDDEKRKDGVLPSPSGMRRYVLDVHGKWGVWRGIVVPETEEGRKKLDRKKAGEIGIWAKSLRDAIHIAKTNYIYDNSPFGYDRDKGDLTIEEKRVYNNISWHPVWIHGYTSDRPGGNAGWYPGKTEAKEQHKDFTAIIDEVERKIDAVQKREFENARRKNQGSAGENGASGGTGGRSGLGYGARGGRGVGASVPGVGGGVRPDIGAGSGAAVVPSGEAGRVAKAGTAVQRDLFDPFYDRNVSLKTIVGENGAIDDKNLPIAKQMLGGRKWHTLSHDEKRRIIDATGWQLNAKDGKWRKVGPGFDLEKTNRLGEVFDAVEDLRKKQKATGRKVDEFALNQRVTEEFRKAIPEELLKMYPKLGELKFRIVDSVPSKGGNSVAAGGFDNRRFMIVFDKRFSPSGKEKNPQELFRVIFEHEVQHAIQNIEGFFGASRFAKPDVAVGLEMEREAHNTPYAEDGELLEDTEMPSDIITSRGYPKPEREMNIRYKSSDSAYIAAGSDDAVFANRESQESKGLYWGKDIVRPSVKDRELERIAQEANDVPGAKDALVDKALGGEGLNEREMRQLVLIERDALNRLNDVSTGMNTDNAKSRSKEYSRAQEGLDRVSLAVQRAISHAGATLREAQKAAWFDTTRDQLAYLERHVRATMAKQGVSGEIPEAMKKMLDAQTKALEDANREVAKAQAELAKANEEAKMLSRDLEIERARGGKPFKMSGDAREKLASLSKKYGFSVTANTMNAIGALARLGGVSNIRAAGLGEGTVISLNDEMRECFGQILADADGDFDKALGLIHGTMDNRFDSAFAQYRAEMEKTPSPDGTKSGKRRVIREKAKKQSEDFVQKNHPALDIGHIAPSGKNLDAMKRKVERERAEAIEMLGDFFANDEMKREVVGDYLRDYMRYYALENPSKTNDEVLQAMLDEANAIDPEHEYHPAEMADVLLGDNGYTSRTRERVSTRMADLQKALSLAKSGDLKGAAEAAGISYRSDTDLILELDHKLRGKINRALDSLDRVMADSATGAGEEAANALRENVNEMVNALRDIHSGGDAGEMLDKYLHLVESMRKARRESTILDTINRHIAELNRRLAENDFEPKAKRVKPNVESYSRAVRRKMEERDKLRKRFEAARANYEYRKRSSIARFTSDIFEILGEVKSIAGALDFSSVLRQGGQLTWAHPLLFAKNFRKMLSVFLNEDKAQAAMDEIRSRPNAKYYEKAGVDFTDWGRDAVNKDDRFLLNQYRRITGWKPLRVSVEASERAFSMYLNLMRADVFDHLVAASTYGDASKMPQKALEAIGDFINIGSQRGAFHSHSEFEKAVKSSIPFLNSFLWSPRNVISRFQFLWQTAKLAMPWANPYGDKALRGLFAKELLRYFGGVAVAITFAKFISDLIRGDDEPPEDLVLDPRSSEFLKVKFGNTRVDFLSGLAQSIVFSARMAPKWIGGGMTVNARGEARPTDHTAVLGRFMRSKFSPAMGILWDMGTGSTFDKQEITYSNPLAYNKEEAGIVSYIAGQVFPLTLSDLWEQASQSGLSNAVITSIGTILGLGTNTYDANTYNNLSADYRFYKKLYVNAESQDEKDRLLKYYPMLKMAGSIEAQIKRVNKIKSDIKKLQKAGGDTSVLDDMLEREKKIAVNMIMGFSHPGQTD